MNPGKEEPVDDWYTEEEVDVASDFGVELSTAMFWGREALQIAEEFDIPRRTARKWSRDIGKPDVVMSILGKNAPTGYIDHIQQLESGKQKQRMRRKWAEPLERNMGEREDYEGKRHELKIKRDLIQYHMSGIDSEFIQATRKSHKAGKALVEIYNNHLDGVDSEFEYKKDEIIELKSSFPYLRANHRLISRATDSSLSYISKFKHVEGNGPIRTEAPESLRQETFERDENRCVSCDATEDLVVHHIIPANKGGKSVLQNLATLCRDCHNIAHGGEWVGEIERVANMNYSEVVYDSQEQFWSFWVAQDHEDVLP